MIIYIRHGHDNESHPKHRHDNRLTKKGKEKARKIIYPLIENYGYPTKIYFSPFIRCRETVAKMLSELYINKFGKKGHFCFNCFEKDDTNKLLKDLNIELICDSRLSRYFTKTDRKKPSVSSNTLKLEPPIHEGKAGLIKRINKYVESITQLHKTDEVAWCITHGIIYKKIASELNINTPDSIGFLEHFVFNV